MKPFDFIIVIISIILGLSISDLTISVARVIREQDQMSFYLPHTIWAISAFILVTNYFFNLFRLKKIEKWSFNSFGLILLTTILIAVNVYLLLPVESNESHYDFRNFFDQNSRKFFINTALIFVMFQVESFFIYRSRSKAGKRIMLYRSVVLALILFNIFFKSVMVDHLVAITAFLLLVYSTFFTPAYLEEKPT